MAGLGFDISNKQMNSILLAHYGVELNQPQGVPTLPAARPRLPQQPARLPRPPARFPKQPPRAGRSELNRLMQNISRETYSEVTSEVLRASLNPLADAAPQKWTELLDLAGQAEQALGAIRDITVNDIIRPNGQDRETQFRDASNRQFELANAMRELAADLRGRTPELDLCSRMLDDLSFKCDSRGSEILTLYMEVETSGKKQMIGDNSSFGTAKAADLMKGMAGSMHGNDKSQLLKDQVDGLERQLAKISGAPKVALNEINRLLEKANALSAELKTAAVSQTMDADIHAKLTEHLDQLESRMGEYIERAVKTSVANTVKQCGSPNKTGRDVAAFIGARKGDFGKLNAMMSALSKLKADNGGSVEDKDLGDIEKLLRDETVELAEEIEKYRQLPKDSRAPDLGGKWDEENTDLDNFLTRIGYSESNAILMAVRVARELSKRHQGWRDRNEVKQRLGGEDVVNVFRHDANPNLSMLVETRINGANEANVNLQLCDKNVIGEKPLGSGVVNKVVKLTYRMPGRAKKDFVFKPDLSGRCGLDGLVLGAYHAYVTAQQSVKLNTATCDMAEFLGLGNLTGKNYVTVHNGQYGLLMEMAPGKVAADIPDDPKLMDLVTTNFKVCGDLAKQLNDLRWLDLATGQGDRHSQNYLVDFSGKGNKPKVTAIDNDMCFSSYMVGIGKFKLNHDNDDADKSQRVQDFWKNLFFYCNNDQKKYNKLGGEIMKNGYVVDTRKAGKEVICALFKTFAYHAPTLPRQMSRSLCNKFMSLTDDDIGAFAKKLAKNVNSKKAVEATKARLTELRKIAIEYNANGLVVEDKDWTKDWNAVKKELDYNVDLTTLPDVPIADENSLDHPSVILPSCTACSLLKRDFADRIA